MGYKDFFSDADLLWEVFKNTGLIGVYLMYEEKKKELPNKRSVESILKKDARERHGKRIKESV